MYPKNSLFAYNGIDADGNFIYDREFLTNLTGKYEKWKHKIAALGGYKSASFTLTEEQIDLDDWWNDGLMRKLIYRNPEGVPIFEGFVSKLAYSFGTDNMTRQIQDHHNRIYMRFTEVTPKGKAVDGDPRVIIVNDTSFQRRFGIKSKVVNGGEITADEAYAWARAELTNGARVKTGMGINVSGTSTPNIKVTVDGFYKTLEWIPYYSTSDDEVPAHDFIKAVLAQFSTVNPGFINTDYSWMDYNFLRVRARSEDYNTCWKLINDVVNYGGLGGERWVLGLSSDRRVIYKPAETITNIYNTEGHYTRTLRDPKKRIYQEGLGVVQPWDMLPDRIIVTIDK